MSTHRQDPLYRVRWGHEDLAELIASMRDGLSLREAAARQGPNVSPAECDRALWAKFGRSIPDACDVLNGNVT